MIDPNESPSEFVNDVKKNGYHILSFSNIVKPDFYLSDFSAYVPPDISKIKIDDEIIVRAFFAVDQSVRPQIDSGLMTLDVEEIHLEGESVLANITTELPSQFALQKNTSIDVFFDEILTLNQR